MRDLEAHDEPQGGDRSWFLHHATDPNQNSGVLSDSFSEMLHACALPLGELFYLSSN